MKVIRVTLDNKETIDLIDCREHVELEKGLFLPANITNGDLVKLAGLDPRKIDFAVPENWMDEYHKEHGYYPKAVWNYTNVPAFGEPLFYSDILKMILARVKGQVTI